MGRVSVTVAWITALAPALAPSVALADDIAQALQFAQGIMGDDIAEGYEDFTDYDETEALALLLSRRVEPGLAPGAYDGSDPAPETGFFATLGGARVDARALASFLEEAAAETRLPVALIDAVIRTESGYRPRAVSRAGAQGLMQLMPATAARLGVTDPFDPRQNILAGARYLEEMRARFGDLELALAAYNAGPARVIAYGGVPPIRETRRYVATVLRRYLSSPLRGQD